MFNAKRQVRVFKQVESVKWRSHCLAGFLFSSKLVEVNLAYDHFDIDKIMYKFNSRLLLPYYSHLRMTARLSVLEIVTGDRFVKSLKRHSAVSSGLLPSETKASYVQLLSVCFLRLMKVPNKFPAL